MLVSLIRTKPVICHRLNGSISLAVCIVTAAIYICQAYLIIKVSLEVVIQKPSAVMAFTSREAREAERSDTCAHSGGPIPKLLLKCAAG